MTIQALIGSTTSSVRQLLSEDLNFQDSSAKHATHDLHAFPAKFPPSLPAKFIKALTSPGDVVLDPMMGSGTTILEAFLLERRAVGVDIDPLAQKIVRAKTTPLDVDKIKSIGQTIIKFAKKPPLNSRITPCELDVETSRFLDYWFDIETQHDLLLLLHEIKSIEDFNLRNFFEIVFSSTIITKTGGVSLALDLAHTRPHRAKIVISHTGQIIINEGYKIKNSKRVKILTKTLRSVLREFERRLQQGIDSINSINEIENALLPDIHHGSCQALPLLDDSVDLIVTSPPYISNAIDYMRAHKFSLTWLGYDVKCLSNLRSNYIGSDSTKGFVFQDLPPQTENIIESIFSVDKQKGKSVKRYYSEMKIALREMHRVLREGKTAILVVGSSTIKGKDTKSAECLSEIATTLGFEVAAIGNRRIDRDRRMLPTSVSTESDSQIEQRMHEEQVIGLIKRTSIEG